MPAEPAAVVRRRRVVVAVTLVLGTALLAATLAVPTGSDAFTVLGLAVAATWRRRQPAVGPAPPRAAPRRRVGRRELLGPVVLGLLAYLGFLGAYLVAREVPGLAGALESILGKADKGPLAPVLFVVLVNGAAEEVFFRGRSTRRSAARTPPATPRSSTCSSRWPP